MTFRSMEDLLRRWKFNLWYYGRPPWDRGVSPPELEDFIRQNPPGRALDLGCGSGTNLLRLARAGWQVTGVDYAWRAVRLARRRLQLAGIAADVLLGDVADLSGVSGPFELILDIGCYHSLPPLSRESYRRNVERLLANGGTFLLYVHCRSGGSRSNHGWDETDEELFRRFLRLIHKQTGQEGRRGPSAWLTFQRERSP